MSKHTPTRPWIEAEGHLGATFTRDDYTVQRGAVGWMVLRGTVIIATGFAYPGYAMDWVETGKQYPRIDRPDPAEGR